MVDGTANQDRFIRRRRFARAFVERALVRRFEYTWDIPEDLPDQFMLLANHGTFLDPVMAYITFPNHPLYFFMGEQVYRTPVLGRVVRYLADPIPVMRQVGDARAVIRALSILKKGGSIGLYPAGECEWDGFGLPIADATGKFVKKAKVPLVTFVFEGMYFLGPRWRAHMRHLPTHGRVVGVYDVETLSSMTSQEVAQLIRRDLMVDSTAWRAAIDVPTRGRNLAMWLETVLYLCPRCGKVGALHTHGNLIECECGLSIRYTDLDVFEEGAPYHTVHEWNQWQRGALEEMVEREGSGFSLSVPDARLFSIEPSVTQMLIASGEFSLSGESVSCGQWSRPFAAIEGLALLESDRVVFTIVGEGHFEIRHARPWNTVMFGDLYGMLKTMRGKAVDKADGISG